MVYPEFEDDVRIDTELSTYHIVKSDEEDNTLFLLDYLTCVWYNINKC